MSFCHLYDEQMNRWKCTEMLHVFIILCMFMRTDHRLRELKKKTQLGCISRFIMIFKCERLLDTAIKK